MDNDVEGARAAGIRAVLVDRSGAPAPAGVETVRSLGEVAVPNLSADGGVPDPAAARAAGAARGRRAPAGLAALVRLARASSWRCSARWSWSGTIAAIVGVDADDESPGFVVIATLAQGAVFVGTAVWFASRVAPPQAVALRPAPRAASGPPLGWAALGVFSFYLVSAIYAALVQPDAEQDVVESLGRRPGHASGW